MARQWKNGKDGTMYTSVSAVWVPADGDKKAYWKIGFTYTANKFCTVRLYSDSGSQYTPDSGRHKGQTCCLANVNMGKLNNNNNGSNFPG